MSKKVQATFTITDDDLEAFEADFADNILSAIQDKIAEETGSYISYGLLEEKLEDRINKIAAENLAAYVDNVVGSINNDFDFYEFVLMNADTDEATELETRLVNKILTPALLKEMAELSESDTREQIEVLKYQAQQLGYKLVKDEE